MALAHPDRIRAQIVQAPFRTTNLGANWKTGAACWADRAANEVRFEPICCRWPQRGAATSEATPTWNAMTRISGQMNSLF